MDLFLTYYNAPPSKVSPKIFCGFNSHSSLLSYIASTTARVCDNELLRCQNGGVCLNNLRCECPRAYTGLLCEKPRCESELGGCGGADSGQAPLSPPSSPRLLLLLLLGSALLRQASYWPTML